MLHGFCLIVDLEVSENIANYFDSIFGWLYCVI